MDKKYFSQDKSIEIEDSASTSVEEDVFLQNNVKEELLTQDNCNNEALLQDDEEEADELLAQFVVDYSKEEAKKYTLTGKKSVFSKGTIAYIIAFAVLAIVFLITKFSFPVFFGCLAIIVLPPGCKFLSYLINANRFYKRTSEMWNGNKTIRIYEGHTETEQDGEIIRHIYDDFYRIKENDDRIYLIAGHKDVVIVDKNKTAPEICDAIRNVLA